MGGSKSQFEDCIRHTAIKNTKIQKPVLPVASVSFVLIFLKVATSLLAPLLRPLAVTPNPSLCPFDVSPRKVSTPIMEKRDF